MTHRWQHTAAVVAALCGAAFAQSSSLYLAESSPPPQIDGVNQNPFMEQASYLAVTIPEPRTFSTHDLVTIIVRESSSSKLESELETEKALTAEGEVTSFPMLDIDEVTDSGLNQGPNPSVGLEISKEFEGEGDYQRKDETIFRITARVVDVKPNGTLVLEARKSIATDKETETITLTGYCRTEDIGADNTVLSTQMYDLRINKQHTGALRKASEKGILTKAFDLFLNF